MPRMNGAPVEITNDSTEAVPAQLFGKFGDTVLPILVTSEGKIVIDLASVSVSNLDITDRDTRQLGIIKRIEEGVIDPRDMRGLAADKPAASAENRGNTYWSVDTDPHQDAVEVSDGTNWVVI